MISISHVDVPAQVEPEDLDRIADEFLWQQGQARRKRRYALVHKDWFRSPATVPPKLALPPMITNRTR